MSKELIIYNLEDSSGCACSCGCGSDGKTIEDMLNDFRSKYPDYRVKVIDLNDLAKHEVIEQVNVILEASGEKLRLKDSNYAFALPKLMPLITYGSIILAVNNVPTMDDLYQATISKERIKTQSGCC